MATKAKTVPPAPAAQTLEARLSEAIALVEAGKAQAAELLDSLITDAVSQSQVAIGRTARHYRAILDRKQKPAGRESMSPESQAVLLLNARRPEEALPVLEAALAKHPEQARLQYLRATSLVQLGRFEDGAEALRVATRIEPLLRFQYRLEPDFNPARRHPAFLDFETA